MESVDEKQAIVMMYRNHRGETGLRHVVPRSIRFGTSEWHPEPQWLLEAFDLDRQAERSFALVDIHDCGIPPR